ncbi:MAG: hypothetical protein LH461_02180 [Spirochaetaceae bacterium]|nr:hypothetical protein [Spirochaetaceae bacterium]
MTEFTPADGLPTSIASGPDGNLWRRAVGHLGGRAAFDHQPSVAAGRRSDREGDRFVLHPDGGRRRAPALLHRDCRVRAGAGARDLGRQRGHHSDGAGCSDPDPAPDPDPLAFYDMSGYGPRALRWMACAVGTSQLVHGTDAPVVAVTDDESLGAAAHLASRTGNVARLLGTAWVAA